jgi:hypothetical protein
VEAGNVAENTRFFVLKKASDDDGQELKEAKSDEELCRDETPFNGRLRRSKSTSVEQKMTKSDSTDFKVTNLIAQR